ncbi:hypothetical protein EJ04DRAFT_399529, partial [Polyplosphaeria fusca]
MSGNSSVGTAAVYEAGDQRNYSAADAPSRDRFEEGQSNSHLAQDSKDERSIANKLAAETSRKEDEEFKSEEDMLNKKDATLPAKAHGNEPSRGAKIDQEIREEEEEMLRSKG